MSFGAGVFDSAGMSFLGAPTTWTPSFQSWTFRTETEAQAVKGAPGSGLHSLQIRCPTGSHLGLAVRDFFFAAPPPLRTTTHLRPHKKRPAAPTYATSKCERLPEICDNIVFAPRPAKTARTVCLPHTFGDSTTRTPSGRPGVPHPRRPSRQLSLPSSSTS